MSTKLITDTITINTIPKNLYGFSNIGNSCWFAALVQSLLSLPKFNEYIIDETEKIKNNYVKNFRNVFIVKFNNLIYEINNNETQNIQKSFGHMKSILFSFIQNFAHLNEGESYYPGVQYVLNYQDLINPNLQFDLVDMFNVIIIKLLRCHIFDFKEYEVNTISTEMDSNINEKSLSYKVDNTGDIILITMKTTNTTNKVVNYNDILTLDNKQFMLMSVVERSGGHYRNSCRRQDCYALFDDLSVQKDKFLDNNGSNYCLFYHRI